MKFFYRSYFFCTIFFAPFFLVAMEKEKMQEKPQEKGQEDPFLKQIAEQIAERKHQQEMARLFSPAHQLGSQAESLSSASLACISDWLRDKELFGD